ncbi:MAG: metallophosphoesterase family protein [Oscillospiraceae bacterium]|nr:metallophosphoesterase family protein [Oscillospiraceae bacterium]
MKSHTYFKRLLSLLLCAVMALSLVSQAFVAIADDSDAYVLLASLVRDDLENALADDDNEFKADDGVLSDSFALTAWDGGQQIVIGGAANRTPIVINNGALVPSPEDADPPLGWKSAKVEGVEKASAFQLEFSTVGFDDVRFSATQKRSGSFGGDNEEFALAYSLTGAEGSWKVIDDSARNVHRDADNTYEVLRTSYRNFALPEELFDRETVFLRVFYNGAGNLGRDGNISINDIMITSGEIPEVFDDSPRLLAGFTYNGSTAAARYEEHAFTSRFLADSGHFADSFTLTAWDDNRRVQIGGAGRAPIVINNAALNTSLPRGEEFIDCPENEGERIKNPDYYEGGHGGYKSAQIDGIAYATGFQLALPTTGFQNIRLSARQKTSASFGPQPEGDYVDFALAYSLTGAADSWVRAEGGSVKVLKRDLNFYDALAQTFDGFVLPAELNNQSMVYLRVFFDGEENLNRNGNMSINTISILGDAIAAGGGADVSLAALRRQNFEDPAVADDVIVSVPEELVEYSFFRATAGMFDSFARLTAWDRGERRLIGYTGTPAAPVVFESSSTGRGSWTEAALDANQSRLANASAFELRLRTSAHEGLTFSASQKATADAATTYALAYRPATSSSWTVIPGSERTVELNDGIERGDLVKTYDRFELPAETANHPEIFLRVFVVAGGEGKGNTSINNIELWGSPLSAVPGFAAEMLGLVVGATTASVGITWHDWTAIIRLQDSRVIISPRINMMKEGTVFPESATTVTASRSEVYDGRTAFMATVDGLKPNTEYAYAVSTDGKNFSAIYYYTTAAAGDFTFVAITDLHLGDPSVSPLDSGSGNGGMLDPNYREGVTVKQGWNDTLGVITKTVPHLNFLATMGDSVDRNVNVGTPEPTLELHQIKYANFFAPSALRSIPFAPTMGNHEARSNITFRNHYNLPNELVLKGDDMLVTSEAFSSHVSQRENENSAHYFYLFNNTLFVVLNTAARTRNILEAERMIEIFDDVLTNAKATHKGEYDWLIVQTHKPMAGMSDHAADFDVQRYTEAGFELLMLDHEVDLVFAGHDHSYTRSFPVAQHTGRSLTSRQDGNGAGTFGRNGVIYDRENDGDEISQGAGTVFFTLNSSSGQKFYPPYWPASNLQNEEYPYLYDGSRGVANMAGDSERDVDGYVLAPGPDNIDARKPWSVNRYHQDNKPMFMEVKVSQAGLLITAHQFDATGKTEVVDTFLLCRCGECGCEVCEVVCGVCGCEDCGTICDLINCEGCFTAAFAAAVVVCEEDAVCGRIECEACFTIATVVVCDDDTSCGLIICELCNPVPVCDCLNCVDCDFLGGRYGFGRVTNTAAIPGVADALSIMRFIIGLESGIKTDNDARAAANITSPGSGSPDPTLNDALAILRYIIGLDSPLDAHYTS